MTDKCKEVGNRIRQRREELKMTQEELGKLLWLNKSTIQRYESGSIKKIKLPILHAMAKQLNVNPEWLALKTDVMGEFVERFDLYEDNPSKTLDESGTGTDTESIFDKFDNIRPLQLKKFPLLGSISCGEPIFAVEDRENYIMADMDIKADFCLRAIGESMINARIFDGDIVFIQKMPMVDNGEIAAVIINDEATLKRVYYYPEKNKLVLNPENPAFEPLVYMNEELDEIRILGRAIYFMSAVK